MAAFSVADIGGRTFLNQLSSGALRTRRRSGLMFKIAAIDRNTAQVTMDKPSPRTCRIPRPAVAAAVHRISEVLR
jgi:hypothetical protein